MKTKYIFLTASYLPQGVAQVAATLVALRTISEGNFVWGSFLYALPFTATFVIPLLLGRIASGFTERDLIRRLSISRILLSVLSTILVASLLGEQFTAAVVVSCAISINVSADQVLNSRTPLQAEQIYGLSYARTSAFANMIGRSQMAVAPMIGALYMHDKTYVLLVIVALGAVGLIYPTLLRYATRAADQRAANGVESVGSEHAERFRPWALWYIVFNTITNLAQGAIAFVILADSDPATGATALAWLYGFFFAIQLLIVFNLLKIEKWPSSPGAACVPVIFTSVLIACLSSDWSHQFGPAIYGCIGVIYGVSIPLTSQAIIGRLKGPRFMEYLAYAKSSGRLATLISVWVAGALLHLGITQLALFAALGTLGCVFACSLLVSSWWIERKEHAANAAAEAL